jgi:hypothetical protein
LWIEWFESNFDIDLKFGVTYRLADLQHESIADFNNTKSNSLLRFSLRR